MGTEIEAKEVKVGSLFSPEFIFIVPIYQRPLSWERENYEQLFDDILESLGNNENQYFLGSIILQESGHDGNRYEIVDGQQRISSLAILLAVIRDSATNPSLKEKLATYLFQSRDEFKNIPEEMRVMPWNDLRVIFKKYVYETGGTDEFLKAVDNKLIKYRDWQDPIYHLYEAIEVFGEKVSSDLGDGEALDSFVKYLLNRVYLVYIKTTTFASAFRLFNVLNARGLSLSTGDLLKSENLGEIKDVNERYQYADIWRGFENRIGREELENVIGYIRTIETKEKARIGIYEEYRKLIYAKNIIQRGKPFIDYLSDIVGIYDDKIVEPKTTLEASQKNEYKNVVGLMRRYVPFTDWVPPVLCFIRKYQEDQQTLPFILKLEKKVILEWMLGFSAQERITSLNRLLKLIEQSDNPQETTDKLLYYRGEETLPGKRARFLEYEQKDKIGKILEEKLDDNQFYNIYGGKLARYVLLRIDMNYWELENFPGYPGTITVEHILPQGPEKDSEWIKLFSEDQRNNWTNKLGNLVLLSGSKNSKARNFGFEKKKEAYFKDKGTAFRITQSLNNIDAWTFRQFEERHQRLLCEAKAIFTDY
jgi:hypothetical protein